MVEDLEFDDLLQPQMWWQLDGVSESVCQRKAVQQHQLDERP